MISEILTITAVVTVIFSLAFAGGVAVYVWATHSDAKIGNLPRPYQGGRE
jgi:hypothetical protein